MSNLIANTIPNLGILVKLQTEISRKVLNSTPKQANFDDYTDKRWQ